MSDAALPPGFPPPRKPPPPPAIDWEHYAAWKRRHDAILARQAAPLTTVLPRERVLILGGEPYRVAELRLSDLADLQAWLAEQVPHPLAELDGADEADRDAAARRAWLPSRDWPPRLGTDAANELMATPEGMIAFVLVCLHRCDPTITAGDAAVVAATMTPEEWRDLRRVAWGTAPWRDVYAVLGPEEPDQPPLDWAEAAAHLAELYGFTPEVLAGLTLGQFRAYRSGRADAYRGLRPAHPGESLKDVAARERQLFGVTPPTDPRRTAPGPGAGPAGTGPD